MVDSRAFAKAAMPMNIFPSTIIFEFCYRLWQNTRLSIHSGDNRDSEKQAGVVETQRILAYNWTIRQVGVEKYRWLYNHGLKDHGNRTCR